MVDMMLARLIAFSLPCMCVYNEYIIDRESCEIGFIGEIVQGMEKRKEE